MIGLVSDRAGISRDEAYMLLSLAGAVRITQIVDGEKGVPMMLRKDWLSAPQKQGTARRHASPPRPVTVNRAVARGKE